MLIRKEVYGFVTALYKPCNTFLCEIHEKYTEELFYLLSFQEKNHLRTDLELVQLYCLWV